MNTKLSLCMIVKPSTSEAQLLDRCLSYVHEYVDEICITQAGHSKSGAVSKVIKKYKAKESFFKWVNDFSKARNFNFSQATGDYIFWLDADDVVKGAEKLKELVKLLDEKKIDVAVMNYLYDFDEYKRCTVKHLKSRIVKKGTVEWVGELHEDFQEQRVLTSYMVEDIEILHLTSDKRATDSAERNIGIALKAIDDKPEDPRSYWLVANAYMGLKNPKAERFYEEFIKRSGSEEEKYLAYLNLAELTGKLEHALMALGIRPTYPNAYFKLAELQYKYGKKQIARDFVEIGLQMPLPETSIIVYNPRDYDYNPLMLLMRIYFELGEYQKAMTILDELLKLYPEDKILLSKKKLIENELGEISKVDEYLEKAPKDKKELKKYLDNLPEEVQAHPKVCVLRNQNFVKEKSSGKDIVYYCGYTTKEWNPEIALNQGIGGSEEAVVNLSKELAKKGWNITVYNNCGKKPQEFDGVKYMPWWMFNPKDKQDVLILWRSPKLVDFELNADKILIDLHDVIGKGEFTEDRLEKIDKIMVKTHSHKILFPNVPNEKFAIIPNGIDPELFEEKTEKNPYLILNTSSPDRHIDATLDIFEELIRREPDKPWKLAWYYGWDGYKNAHANDPALMKWMGIQQQRFNKLKKEGRAEGGHMISHKEIAKKYLEAGIFLYPTQFYEIHCISAVKGQLAECAMVTSDFAALNETVKFGNKIHTEAEKWGTQPTFGDSQIDKYITAIKTTKPHANQKDKMIKEYNWEKVSEQWSEFLSIQQ